MTKAKHLWLVEMQIGLSVVIIVLVLVGCGAKKNPFAVGDRTTTNEGTSTSVPAGQQTTPPTQATGTQVNQGEQLVSEDIEGPSKDELIKFANWDEKRVKLTNYIAGYIIAHGLDHPVRMIDVSPETYQDALTNNDVDIVLEATSEWAHKEAEAGNVILLGTLSSIPNDTNIAVHVSMKERAPDVIEFLNNYTLDEETIREQSAKITGGRVGLSENVLGLIFLTRQEETWRQWVEQSKAELVKQEVDNRTVSLCREWQVRFADRYNVKYCRDDPSITQPDQ